MVDEFIPFGRLDHTVEGQDTTELFVIEDDEVLVVRFGFVGAVDPKTRVKSRMKGFLEPIH